MKKFALIGAAGYIAPRHMKAIKSTGNCVSAALDPNDSVGILDSYFPDAHFFTEFERFDRHIDKQRRIGNTFDYLSICSPNYLRDSHVRFGLRSGMNVVCEKPLVLNPWNLDALKDIEQESGKRVFTILQLRLHNDIQALKSRVEKQINSKMFDVDLTYITSRGRWYLSSWKGDVSKSGGIATNIGVHFFDMLSYVFGELQENEVHHLSDSRASGFLEFKHARVRWFLSIEASDLPNNVESQQRTFRSITCDGEEIEFSDGFTDLHSDSYRKILTGDGFGIDSCRTSIEIVSEIRKAKIVNNEALFHPYYARICK